jgi:hypothetical protein
MSYQRFNRQRFSGMGAPPPGPMPMSPKIPSLDEYSAKNFYVYEVFTTSALAAGGSAPLNFTVDADADFFWTKLTAFALVDDDGTTYSAQQLPGITALITNGTTGRNFSSAAVPLPNMAGTAQFPFILPQQTFIGRTGQIQIQLNNVTDNTSYSLVHLSFMGIKAFK